MIYIVANSRAESGPLQSVISALPEARVIGFTVDGKAEPHVEMAYALHWFTDKLRDASLVILLGDRFETLGAALSCMFLRVRIVHIHGGETTTGAFDDACRHAITHITEQSGGVHCVATSRAQQRVQMLTRGVIGNPYVYLVGAPGLDGVPKNSAKRDMKLILVTYHPETMAADRGLAGCKEMLKALESYPEHQIYFCGVNTDPGNREINSAIETWCYVHDNADMRIMRVIDMPHDMYIGMMQHAELVIGNSSAGVIEAPWVGCPSINLGMRQDGRETAGSVWNIRKPTVEGIRSAIRDALNWTGSNNPIYRGGAAPRIAKIVRSLLTPTSP